MRLFGKPGGDRAQWRAALVTIPFDLVTPMLSSGTPERTFAAGPRGDVFCAAGRGQTFEAAVRGSVFETNSR